MYPHDKILKEVHALGKVIHSKAWANTKAYSWPGLAKWAIELLAPYKI